MISLPIPIVLQVLRFLSSNTKLHSHQRYRVSKIHKWLEVNPSSYKDIQHLSNFDIRFLLPICGLECVLDWLEAPFR